MIRRPPRSTLSSSSAASDVYKRQGISISGSYPLTTKLNIRGNLMVSQRYTISNVNIGNQSTGVRARLNLNATYQLNKDLVFELFGFYSSPSQNIQGKK